MKDMNEDSLDNQFDPWEIDKIQAEIDKDLNIGAEADLPEESESPNGLRETVEESVITEALGENKAISDGSCDFFKETVKNQPKRSFKHIAALVCVAAVLCGLSAGFALFAAGTWHGARGGAQISARTEGHFMQPIQPNFSFVQDMELQGNPQIEHIYGVMSFANLIESIKPSVVCLTAYKPVTGPENFFNIPGFGAPDNRSGTDRRLAPHGGSGIIFDQDDERLFIVTNNHVIVGAERVGVSFNGSEDVPAHLIGRDVDSDLAVLSVAIRDVQALGINDFTIAAFANSESMRVGDFVIAVGNALGRGATATFGFVSAVDMEVEAYGRTFTVIQTDAAINPGNSGGPLLNLRGEVIGINMLKFVDASVEGTGYALTSNVAMPIIERIRNQVARPLLGIQGSDMTETAARAFNLPMMGIIVEVVIEGSGAYRAGIRRTDIITSFNGYPVLNMQDLSERVQSHDVGDTVEITLIRDGRDVITLEATLLEANNTNF